MSYLENTQRKIRQFYEAYHLIKQYPNKEDGYFELYHQYMLSKPYLKTYFHSDDLFIGSLGKFHFFDIMFDVSHNTHKVHLYYDNDKISLDCYHNIFVATTNFSNEQKYFFENEFLHSFQSNNAQEVQSNLENLLN